jgi:hypothetical protein
MTLVELDDLILAYKHSLEAKALPHESSSQYYDRQRQIVVLSSFRQFSFPKEVAREKRMKEFLEMHPKYVALAAEFAPTGKDCDESQNI